jgi:Peptidase family M23
MATSFASLVLRRACLVLITALAALLSPAAADAAYSWPLKPFDQQHPVRGFFGDPRVGESATGRVESKTFHFGIDISAPDGTAVYAISSGRVVWESQRPETIAIRASGGSVFAYWHIVPAVRNGQYAVASKTILGRIARGWGHVHLAELVDGRYVNPLRRGALTPYVDSTRPTIHAFSFERAGRSIGRRKLAGRFDLVSETWDETPVSVPGKWANRPVMPAVVRWRILGTRVRHSWQTALDFSATIPAPEQFDSVYARWTRQNHAWRPGRYRVQIARDWDSASLRNGTYVLEVEAIDTRGNRTRRAIRFSISN